MHRTFRRTNPWRFAEVLEQIAKGGYHVAVAVPRQPEVAGVGCGLEEEAGRW